MATDTSTETIESGWKQRLGRLRPAVELLGASFALGAFMLWSATAIVVVNEVFAQNDVWVQLPRIGQATVGAAMGVPLGAVYALAGRYVIKLIAGTAPKWESVALWGAAAGGILTFAAEYVI